MRRTIAILLGVMAIGILSVQVARAADPVIAAAGDIACNPTDAGYNGGLGTATRCQQAATSNLLVGTGLTAVLTLGDMQYNTASTANIAAVYDPTWGRVKSITHPSLGEHESTANAYFNYWNGLGVASGVAGTRGQGWYSFNIGSWHLIALNSVCTRVGCGAGSPQETWLRADLAANPMPCTLAYSHDPRFSSGHGGDNADMQPMWSDLYNAGAELLISGHSHDYERLAPMNANGAPDPARGIRQFVVGTGGAFFTGWPTSHRRANSEVSQNNTFGVLKLTLGTGNYSWQFVPIAGQTFTDAGLGVCH